MKTILTLLFVLLAGTWTEAEAATVQGTVMRRSMSTYRPAANLLLTLRGPNNVRSARVYTDNNGEFWFYGVPRGQYVLEIWRSGMDESGKGRSSEACRIEVAGADVSVRTLRLQSSPLRVPAEIRDCSMGLEHLYTSG